MGLAGKKVYFPVESMTGLGHLNRTGKLVREMVGAGLGVTVAGGSLVDARRFFAGAECRQIPALALRDSRGYFEFGADGARSYLRDFNAAARQGERIGAHLANFCAVKPDILISEFWPFNRPAVDFEMESLLKASKETGSASLRLVSIRDVLEPLNENSTITPAEVEARHDWVVKTINGNFDAVLVHGDPGFIPLKETFAAAAKITVPVIYTGYVVDSPAARDVAAGGPDAPILVSCGAGYNCHELVFSFLTSWQHLLDRRESDPETAKLVNRPVQIVCGPRFNPEAFEEVKEWAQMLAQKSGHPIMVERYREDFTSLLAKAAFSISFAGYNTTLETLALDVPALLIPNYGIYDNRMRINAEQLYRLQRLEERGLAAFAHPNDVQNSRTFAAIMVREFSRQTAEGRAYPKLDFSGAEHSVAAIESLMREKQKRGFRPVSLPVAGATVLRP